MDTPPPSVASPEPRRQAILAAGFEAFRRYGYRRTSMEDIAHEAGMSRAALYLHYRNKQDIFRSLVQDYFDATEARMAAVLSSGVKPKQALTAAFAAKLGPEMEALFNSPHGAELIDANISTAGDIIATGEARLVALLADWLKRESAARRITLTAGDGDGDAEALAQTMISALGGLKVPGVRFDALRASAQRLALLFARGLKA